MKAAAVPLLLFLSLPTASAPVKDLRCSYFESGKVIDRCRNLPKEISAQLFLDLAEKTSNRSKLEMVESYNKRFLEDLEFSDLKTGSDFSGRFYRFVGVELLRPVPLVDGVVGGRGELFSEYNTVIQMPETGNTCTNSYKLQSQQKTLENYLNQEKIGTGKTTDYKITDPGKQVFKARLTVKAQIRETRIEKSCGKDGKCSCVKTGSRIIQISREVTDKEKYRTVQQSGEKIEAVFQNGKLQVSTRREYREVKILTGNGSATITNRKPVPQVEKPYTGQPGIISLETSPGTQVLESPGLTVEKVSSKGKGFQAFLRDWGGVKQCRIKTVSVFSKKETYGCTQVPGSNLEIKFKDNTAYIHVTKDSQGVENSQVRVKAGDQLYLAETNETGTASVNLALNRSTPIYASYYPEKKRGEVVYSQDTGFYQETKFDTVFLFEYLLLATGLFWLVRKPFQKIVSGGKGF